MNAFKAIKGSHTIIIARIGTAEQQCEDLAEAFDEVLNEECKNDAEYEGVHAMIEHLGIVVAMLSQGWTFC